MRTKGFTVDIYLAPIGLNEIFVNKADADFAQKLSFVLYVDYKAKLKEIQAKVEEAWKACPDDGLEWLTGLREYLKKELEDADRPA